MASQRKSYVFRVTGLSKERPDGDLKTALQEILDDSLTDDETSQIKAEITIVPSCYESDTHRVALVQFRGGVPQFLGEVRLDPLGDWQVEMGDDDINLTATSLDLPSSTRRTTVSQWLPSKDLCRSHHRGYECQLTTQYSIIAIADWMDIRMDRGREEEFRSDVAS
jgi:hypothetical protein